MGGVITPPERLKSELLDPLADGTAGALAFLAPCSSPATAAVTKPRKAIARSHILPVATSKGVLIRGKHCKWAANPASDQPHYSGLNDKRQGAIATIMQRLYEDDLVGHVLAQEPWEVLSFPRSPKWTKCTKSRNRDGSGHAPVDTVRTL